MVLTLKGFGDRLTLSGFNPILKIIFPGFELARTLGTTNVKWIRTLKGLGRSPNPFGFNRDLKLFPGFSQARTLG